MDISQFYAKYIKSFQSKDIGINQGMVSLKNSMNIVFSKYGGT